MNDYQDQTIAPGDLDANESLSSFTTCTFEGAFENFNFSYALFTGCDFSAATFYRCNFTSIDGTGPAGGNIEFASAPAADDIVNYGNKLLGIGDGIETTYVLNLLDIDDDLVVVLEIIEGPEGPAYRKVDAPFVSTDSEYEQCNLTVGAKTRTEALADYNAVRFLSVDSDAVDSAEPIDGIKDITADGVSTCKILIEKQDRAGDLSTGTETVVLSTTRGKLAALAVDLVDGAAEVVLTSAPETTVATITVSDEAGVLIAGETQVQFAP